MNQSELLPLAKWEDSPSTRANHYFLFNAITTNQSPALLAFIVSIDFPTKKLKIERITTSNERINPTHTQPIILITLPFVHSSLEPRRISFDELEWRKMTSTTPPRISIKFEFHAMCCVRYFWQFYLKAQYYRSSTTWHCETHTHTHTFLRILIKLEPNWETMLTQLGTQISKSHVCLQYKQTLFVWKRNNIPLPMSLLFNLTI